MEEDFFRHVMPVDIWTDAQWGKGEGKGRREMKNERGKGKSTKNRIFDLLPFNGTLRKYICIVPGIGAHKSVFFFAKTG